MGRWLEIGKKLITSISWKQPGLNSKIPGAPNFKYKEFVKSDTATRLGIVNTPNKEQWQNIERLAVNVLQPIRDKFGSIRITSGFRSEELCIAVGSFSMVNGKRIVTSNHARGEASDIEPATRGVTLMDVVEWAYNNLEFRTIICEYFDRDGWIHIDYRENGNLHRLKLKDADHNYENIDLDYLNKLYGNNI